MGERRVTHPGRENIMSEGTVMKQYRILQKLKDVQYNWNRMWEWREARSKMQRQGNFRSEVTGRFLGQGKGLQT